MLQNNPNDYPLESKETILFYDVGGANKFNAMNSIQR